MKGYWQAAIGGGLLAVSFSYFCWETSLLSFFFFALMFQGFLKRRNFLVGFIGGMFYFVPTLYWIYPTLRTYGMVSIPLSILALIVLSTVLALFFGLFSWLLRFFQGGVIYISPFLWAAIEILRENIFTGFPWGSLGYTAVEDLPFLQLASLGGVRLMGILMVFLAILLVSRKTKVFLYSFIFLHFIGFLLIGPYETGRYKVAIFQNAWDFKPPLSQLKENEVFNDYMKMAEEASSHGVQLMVFPETTVPFIYLSEPSWENFFKRKAREWNAYIVFSSTEVQNNKLYNADFLISPEGEISTYEKIHLVPFGEYNPIPVIKRIIPRIAMEIGDFTPGEKVKLLNFKGHKFATPICYEAIFPMLVRKMVANGAEFLVNTTNDAWYGRTSAPYQHLMQARVRAVENRRYLLRAASSGISAVIDPYGRILKKTSIYKTEMIIGKFSPHTKMSVFTRVGVYLDWFYIGVVFVGLVIIFLRRS